MIVEINGFNVFRRTHFGSKVSNQSLRRLKWLLSQINTYFNLKILLNCFIIVTYFESALQQN